MKNDALNSPEGKQLHLGFLLKIKQTLLVLYTVVNLINICINF